MWDQVGLVRLFKGGQKMPINAPCLNCKDRKVTNDYNCHSVCEKYLAFKKERAKYNQEQATKSRLNYIDHKRIIRGGK